MAVGISAWNGTNSSNIEIDANSAKGILYWILAQNEGDGSNSITVDGRVTGRVGIGSVGPANITVTGNAEVAASQVAITTDEANDILNLAGTLDSGSNVSVLLYDGVDTVNIYSSADWTGAINGGSGENHVNFLFAREEISSFETFIDASTLVTRFQQIQNNMTS